MLFSDEAKKLMCDLFLFGKGMVCSRPPHINVQRNQRALDELISAGLVSKKPYDEHDVWVYEPTERLAGEAEKHTRWFYTQDIPGFLD